MGKQKRIIRNAAIALVIVTLFFVLMHQIRNERIVRVESPGKIVMNTVARITVLANGKEKAQKCIDAGFEKIVEVEKLMNRFDPDSQISKVNMLAAKDPVRVDKELFDILLKSIEYYKLTDGIFDITVTPLVDLWKKCAEANSLPTDKQLAKVKKIIGCDKLLLDANDFSVRFAVEGMKLDLGGIAKGFAVDLAKNAMLEAGARGGLIAIGGEICCFGTNQESRFWTIGIQNPFSAQEENFIAKLGVTGKNISTSGNYRRFYEIQGKHYSHIINPKTGKSVAELAGVTVISQDGPQADVFATAISVRGVEKGLELIEKTLNTEAILIKPNKDILMSSGASQYLIK